MNEKYNLIAFMATLFAIVVLVIFGAMVAMKGQSTEALGIGAAVTGLIGVIGTFRPRNSPDNQDVTVTNSLKDPVPTTEGD